MQVIFNNPYFKLGHANLLKSGVQLKLFRSLLVVMQLLMYLKQNVLAKVLLISCSIKQCLSNFIFLLYTCVTKSWKYFQF